MRWPWQGKPLDDEVAKARIEELNSRHRTVLKRARRVLSVASDDIEKIIVDDYARAERERRQA